MAVSRTSRELSARVEQQFHRRGRPMRRLINWCSLWVCVLAGGMVLLAMATGDRQIYQSGPVAPAHRLIENDCQACHDTWTPWARFVSFSDQITSAPDEKCQKCHEGPPHYQGQVEAHDGIQCAICHREHRHDLSLVEWANKQCIGCHQELTDHWTSTQGDLQFVANISDFAADHPEFAVHRLMSQGAGQEPIPQKTRDLIDNATLRDAASIKFNHKTHLRAKYDATGKLVEGILNAKGEFEDLSKDCQRCHEPDAQRRLMKPIEFERHCQECHPLWFDLARPGEEVPHEEPDIVLGYLTRRFTLQALAGLQAVDVDPSPARPLPGAEHRRPLSVQLAKDVNARLALAEQTVKQHVHTLFGHEAKGGCKFCHDVRAVDDPDADGLGSATGWEIRPPQIPTRWFFHAEFSHDSHRLMDCAECHFASSSEEAGGIVSITQSQDTGDVLMPTIAVCRKCHNENPAAMAGIAGPVEGVRARCIDCHTYHDRTHEKLSGSLTSQLTLKPRPGQD